MAPPPDIPANTSSSVAFSHLASRAATLCHAELRALLLALPALADPARKTALLSLLLTLRHRLARLLAALRWARLHAADTAAATALELRLARNDDSLEAAADALWDVRHILRPSHLAPPALDHALAALAAAAAAPTPPPTPPPAPPLPPAPRKHLLATDVSEVTHHSPASPALRHPAPPPPARFFESPSLPDRLALATRTAVRDALLHTGALSVLAWRSPSAADPSPVSVGVPHLWRADVLLDLLSPSASRLRVHSLAVHVAAHPDAPAPPAPLLLDVAQNAILRRAADDRMAAALRAAHALLAKTSPAARAPFNPVATMLCALRDMMADDVCAPLAIDLLRAQATALADGAWKGALKVDGANSDASRADPLTVHYWLADRQPALIRITELRPVPIAQSTPTPTPGASATATGSKVVDASPIRSDDNDDTLDSSYADASLERGPGCVSCIHEPPLPNAVELGASFPAFELKMDALNLEDLLMAAIKLRSRARLKFLADSFLKKRAALRIHPSCIVLSRPARRASTVVAVQDNAIATGTAATAAGGGSDRLKAAPIEDALQIQLDATGTAGVDFRIFNTTGGIRLRPYGAAALSLPVQRFKDPRLWAGAKHFDSPAKELEASLAAFEAMRARVKLNSSARSVCALDIGVSNTLPPGTASVAAMASPDRAASQLVPPFAPLERRAPRRFLTLSPPPPQKNVLNALQSGGTLHMHSRARTSGSRGVDRAGSSKRPRLTYATTSDALVFIQESSFAGEDWQIGPRALGPRNFVPVESSRTETESVDRYNGTAAAAAAWAVTRDVVERRLRRDSLLRAFVAANVASSAQANQVKASDEGDLHLESASRVLLKVKCEPLPVQKAELLLRGYDAWQVRLSLLPRIFDSTDTLSGADDKEPKAGRKSREDGNLWSVGVACTGSQLTFTYPSANAASVRSFFRDLTRARTAAALARGVPPSPFYRVLRRSPVRIVVGLGPYGPKKTLMNTDIAPNADSADKPKPQYTATVEYVYSKGNSGGFSLSFSPTKQTMEELAPLIEEALDASGGQVGGILAGLLERACPVAAAAESAVRERVNGRIRFVTALRVRAVFAGALRVPSKEGAPVPSNRIPPTKHPQILHAVDVDARGGSGLVTVIDVGRATAVMIQQGFAHRSGSSGGGNSHRRNDFAPLPKWDEILAALTKDGYAEPQRAGSTVVLKMEVLEQFLSGLVTAASRSAEHKK